MNIAGGGSGLNQMLKEDTREGEGISCLLLICSMQRDGPALKTAIAASGCSGRNDARNWR